MGRVTAIVGGTGGVGKTTVAINLAAALAEKGKRVLVIDLSPQGGATSGLMLSGEADSSVLFTSPKNSLKAIVKTKADGLFAIPAGEDLHFIETDVSHLAEYERRLRSAVETLRADYDQIFFDCPSTFYVLSFSALAAADGYLLPLSAEYAAMEGVKQISVVVNMVRKKYNPDIDFDGAVISSYDGRSLLSRQICEDYEDYFDVDLFSTRIPRSVRISEAPTHGLPVLIHDGKSNGAAAFRKLAEEFIERFQ